MGVEMQGLRALVNELREEERDKGSGVLAVYGGYRVVATSISALRRVCGAGGASDPISRAVGLVVRLWDPSIDQDAWSRAASFALVGCVLACSASTAAQTINLFSPSSSSSLSSAPALLALAQLAATYLLAASMLLRSLLPAPLLASRAAILAALDTRFVDSWFDLCFLLGAAGSFCVLWAGRREDAWEAYGEEELGVKRL
ncbi:hypothetical protein CDD81_5766 [Ophiocordyceps australis]|uniref:Abscisic acid G-protein coupled receptor-like domain-containing protein n=1 Tax=Ophiocordyceps australis TaxID=1399860 RepID=A0A2C5Y1W3_9HYPO|nr:hypothetical protein CDD81_5766 [Ophiocordyceps australis]